MPDHTKAAIVLPLSPGGYIHLALRQPGTRFAGLFVPPGGHRDTLPDGTLEPARLAAVRELDEETRLLVPASRLFELDEMTAMAADGEACGGTFYLLHLLPGESLLSVEPEMQGPWRAYTYRDAATLPLTPVCRSLVLALAAGYMR
jgi:8-oxo-dGTP pyrophosphatase MutT (NUDIX family)